MEMLKRLEPITFALMFLGALNWGIVGLFDTNLIAEVFGTGTATDVVYALIGVSALAYLPKLIEELHLDGGVHPHRV